MEPTKQQQLDEEYDALDDAPDFLDEFIAEAAAQNPEFPALLDEARARRALVQALADARAAAHLNQATVAARMDIAQPNVARLEAGAVDPRLSTLQRYAASIGKRLAWQIVDADAQIP
jgi:DNA-binding XRE family transcriptional regulator